MEKMRRRDVQGSFTVARRQPLRLATAALDGLFAPVDIAVLVYFRVAFGALMFVEMTRYLLGGRVARYYIDPLFHFRYLGFEWVHPWPGIGMYLHFIALAVLALCIAGGFRYRVSAALFFLGYSYVFLLDQALYLNHAYLICLLSLILIFIPAHRKFSLDARLNPALSAETAPRWALWLLRFQMGVPYFFGGVAKLNGDWLRGQPMRMWLASRTDFPLIGPLLTADWATYFFSYGGLFFDLLVVPLLLYRRTRPYTLVVAILFHLTNARLFSIGVFPWLMIAATFVFLPPSWPRRLFGGASVPSAKPTKDWSLQRNSIVVILGLFVAYQVLMPLRHFLYPGDVNWTEEGHRFSWHMKLRDKEGKASFFVTDLPTQTTWEVEPSTYLTASQIDEMAGRPDMLLQFSHFLAEQFRRMGYSAVEVRAWVMVSLNGRPPRLLIDPTVDLTLERRSWTPAPWIMPCCD